MSEQDLLKKLDIKIYAFQNFIQSLRTELKRHKEERRKCLRRARFSPQTLQ